MSRLTMLFGFAIALTGISSAFCATIQDEANEAAKKHDQLKMKVQAICPVTGNELGSHGDPIKVKIGEEQIFLCCKGCVGGKVDPKHWATIHANFAKAQATCPIMGKDLPEDAKWVIVEGQVFYVCCPPCIEKIQAEPAKNLAELDKAYAKYLEEKE